MAHHPFASPEVKAAFAAYPQRLRIRLLAMREEVLAAGEAVNVGGLEESLKWGEPAWRPTRARTGTTVRIGPSKDKTGTAMLVHCQTRLADEFRAAYPDQLEIVGNRAVRFALSGPLPKAIIRHCAAMAFTYHRRNR